jgi:hypothetical protein
MIAGFLTPDRWSLIALPPRHPLRPFRRARKGISEGTHSVPSATGAGRNVAVYLANTAAGSGVVCNRSEVWRPSADHVRGSMGEKSDQFW